MTALKIPFLYRTPEWEDEYEAIGSWQEPEIPALTVPTLGIQGRWGNSLLQYIFLRVFANKYGFILETPDWIGRHIFELNDPIRSRAYTAFIKDSLSLIEDERNYPQFPFDINRMRIYPLIDQGRVVYQIVKSESPCEKIFPTPSSAEIEGLFLVHTNMLAPYKHAIMDMCKPIKSMSYLLQQATDKLRSLGDTLIGIHIRRGDFFDRYLSRGFELITPIEVYQQWLDEIIPTLQNPVVFICSDDDSMLEKFSAYKAVNFTTLGIDFSAVLPTPKLAPTQLQQTADFFPDWYLLTQCNILAISNSTFSFSAALLNSDVKRTFRPCFNDNQLIEFDVWNSEPLLFTPTHNFLLAEIYKRIASAPNSALFDRLSKSILYYLGLIGLRLKCAFALGGWPMFGLALSNYKLYLHTHFKLITDKN